MPRQTVPPVEHGQHHAEKPQLRVEALLDLFIGLQQLDDAFQGKELALKRHKDLPGGAQGIERKQAERRGAIQYNEIKTLFQRLQQLGKIEFPPHLIHKLQFRRRQIRTGRQEEQVRRNRGQNGLVDLFRLEERRVQIGRQRILTEAEPASSVRLRIAVHEQHAFFHNRQ